jgi:hypothetical protein
LTHDRGKTVTFLAGGSLVKRPPAKAQPFLIGMAIGLLLGVLILDIVLPSGVVGGVVYVSIVMLSLASDRRMLTFLTAFAFTCLITYDHLHLMMVDTLDKIPWAMAARLGLILLGIWVPFFAAMANKKVEEHVELVNTPLHLCPSCKKIRDDKGVWSKIDEFVKQEMDREAVAGMCPGCRSRWTAGQAAYRHM